MSRLGAKLKERKLSAKEQEPKVKKSKTYEEVVAGNTKVAKAISFYHAAQQELANAKAKETEAKKVIVDFGLDRMWERQNTQNITLIGKDEAKVYVALKDQYTVKVNPETGRCDELESYLKDKMGDKEVESMISYQEKASLDIKKMSDDELDKLVNLLGDTFGQERMDEIFSVKTEPVINGLVDVMPTICKTKEDFVKIRTLSKQHNPTVNIPTSKPSGSTKKK